MERCFCGITVIADFLSAELRMKGVTLTSVSELFIIVAVVGTLVVVDNKLLMPEYSAKVF